MLYLLITFLIIPFFANSCVLLADDAKPKGLEERAIDSEVVLAGYTRTVYKTKNNTTSYSAEFLVFNILKGEKQLTEIYQQRKPSPLETALNRRLVNASNFGDPSKCQSDVNPGETYILFFDVTADGQLTARYDGVYGPAVVYSRDKELALEAIGEFHNFANDSPMNNDPVFIFIRLSCNFSSECSQLSLNISKSYANCSYISYLLE